MKKALFVAVAMAALVALPVASWAQAKPDFSGSWAMDPAKSDPAPARGGGGAPGGGGGGGGQRGGGGRGGGVAMQLTIKQTATQLTIDSAMGQGTQTAVYKLDGSESTNTMGQGEAKSKAMWDGAKLVITTSQAVNGPNGAMTIDSKVTYSMDGASLVLDTSRTTPAGAQNRKLVYNKGM
jgi:hypothetical protein